LTAPEKHHVETARIERAVLDYYEGWFEADPARTERALHPDLAKRTTAGWKIANALWRSR